MKKFLYILIALAFPTGLLAQQFVTQLERNTIYIGEQNVLSLDASAYSDKLILPLDFELKGVRLNAETSVNDTLDLEIISRFIDSTKHNVFHITFTVWDSGLVTILPISIDEIGNELSDPQLIRVLFPDIDPAGDIQDIVEGQFFVEEEVQSYLWWIVGGIVTLAMLLLIIFILRKRKKTDEKQEPEEILSLREQTERLLTNLYTKKYWLTGQQKKHFIELTDIMRWYVQKRYGIQALEKTTMELNAAMRIKLINPDHVSILTDILKQADFVKFAKFQLPEDEISVLNQRAFNFIELTEDKTENTKEEV